MMSKILAMSSTSVVDVQDGNSVVDSIIEYATSASGTVVPGTPLKDGDGNIITDINGVVLTQGSWSAELPTIAEGEWLWTRTRTIYSDGQFTIVYNVSRSGMDGAQGDPGATVSREREQWYVSTSSTSVTGGSWSYEEPDEIPENKYLWGRVELTMSDGSVVYSDAVHRSTISGLINLADEVNKKITQKIWQDDISSSINAYDGTTGADIRSRVSQTEQDITGITSTVSDISSELSTKADGEEFKTLKNTVTTNEQTASSFRQTVTSTYAKLSDVDKAIGDIKIGGNNLYVIADEVQGYLHASSGAVVAPQTIQKERTSQFIPVKEGESYVIQSWATPTTKDGESWLAYQYYSNSTGTPVGERVDKYGRMSSSGVETTADGQEHLTYKITIPEGVKYLRVSYRHFDDGYAMVEKATTASEYAINPRDLEKYADDVVNTAKSEIKQTTDNILLQVSSKVGADEVISKINLSPETATISAGKVDLIGNVSFNMLDNTTQTKINTIESTANTANSTADEALSSANLANDRSVPGLAMKINYSAFSTFNNGECYIHGFNSDNEPADVNGYVYWKGRKINVARVMINPNDVCPFYKTIYLVVRLTSASANSGSLYMVWYDSGWKYAETPTPGSVGGTWSWVENRDVIIGQFVEPHSEGAIVDAKLYDPAKTAYEVITTLDNPYGYAYDAVVWTTNNGTTTKNAIDMIKKWTNGAISDTTTIQGGWIATNTITSSQLATDAIMSNNYRANTDTASPYSIEGTFLDLANGNFWTPNFGVIQVAPSGTTVTPGAWFSGTVYGTAGRFGSGSSYWNIEQVNDYNMGTKAALVGTGNAYLQTGNWQVSDSYVSTRKYASTSEYYGQATYYKDNDTNTFYDVGMKMPSDFNGYTKNESAVTTYNRSFFYGRKYTGNSVPGLDSSWTYFFCVDNEGNIYEQGQPLNKRYAAIGDVEGQYISTTGGTVNGNLIVKGTLTATASAASKVTSALSVNGKSFDGSAAVTVGTIGVAYGGTGATSFTAGTVLIGNGSNAIQTRAIRNNTAIGYLGWTGANVDNTLITTNTLAYWDGRFNNTNSNIRYVYQGKLGDIVTHNIDEFITTDGGSVTELTAGNLIVTGAGRFTNGLYGDLTGNITGGSTKVFDSGNGTATTFAYSKSGLTANWTATPWFAAWNGYELRAISAANVKTTLGLNNVENTADANKNVLSATKFTSAQSVTLTGDTTGTASSTAGWSVATTTKKLTSLGRLESANVDNTSADYKSKISYFYSSSSMTEGKPPIDGGILNFAWDSSRWGAQLAIKIDTTPHIYIRGSNNTSWDETWLTVLDSNNYNIYAPSKAGTGATGTWGISITGNAATATIATTADVATSITPTALTNQDLNDYHTVEKTLYYYAFGSNNVSNNPANSKTTPDTNAGRQFGMVTYASAGAHVTQELASNGTKWIRFYDGSSNSWSSWNKFLTSGNYTDYTVTKTGTGASGTWGISVTGSAGTAGSLTTGRDFTIGKTKKPAVKWDGAVTFTQAEISDCATDGANGWMSKEDKAKLDSITVSDIGTVGADTIRGATNGGINVTISSGIATIKHTNQLTAGGTAQGTANNTTLTNGGSFTVPTVTYDINGHITATGTNKLTLPSITTITGNAGTATKFASAQAVTLTGDTTGTASSQAGWSVATTTKKISASGGRIDSADIQIHTTQQNKMTFAIASSSMTTHKPPAGDGYILTFGWDNGGWGSQFYVQHTKTPQAMIRGAASATIDGVANSSDWGEWQYLLDSHNYNTYAPKLDGTGATGTWDIGISGNAATATTATTATKLSTSAGSWGTPVYFNNGVPEKTTYLSLQPENDESITLPFLFNDLAYLDKRGGSYEMYSTTATSFTALSINKTPISIDLTKAFDGSPTYAGINRPQTEKTVIDITCPQTFTYTNTFYIDFGSANWRAKSIQLLVYNSATESTYVSKGSIANNVFGHWMVKFGHNSTNSSGTQVSGFNRIRIVLSGWAINAQNRIAQIGIVNYGGIGTRMTHMSRGIDDPIHRSITPNTDNTYDLGTSSKKWSNIYATKFTGNLVGDVTGNATTATTASRVSGVAGTINADRHVWFSDSATETVRGYDDDFKYNPATNTLTVANVSGTATKANQDGDGNTISSTYAKLSGATFTGAVTGTSFAASSYIAANSGNSGAAGGIALYGVAPTAYGIAMRQTSNGGKHGHVQGDWAIYSYMSGADNRGWILKNNTAGATVASVDNAGNAAFNGEVSIGTSGTNIDGSCSLIMNKTLGCLDFVFN